MFVRGEFRRGEFIKLRQKQSDLLEERKSKRGGGGGRQSESWWWSLSAEPQTWKNGQSLNRKWGAYLSYLEPDAHCSRCSPPHAIYAAHTGRGCRFVTISCQSNTHKRGKKPSLKFQRVHLTKELGKKTVLQSSFSWLLIGGSCWWWWCNSNVPELPNAKTCKSRMFCAALMTHQVLVLEVENSSEKLF